MNNNNNNHEIKKIDCDEFVTVVDIESADDRIKSRLQTLQHFFCQEFQHQPEFFVRVPGRVNIIGEHVDYCGYPVLPMAIEQCILLAVSKNPDEILYLRNSNRKYEDFQCDLKLFNINLPDADSPPKWYNYFLCGIKGVFDCLSGDYKHFGMSVALCGNIPPSSGLSSSSALVSSAALATAYLTGTPLKRNFLASISAKCEQYIGTQGGGMDQAIAYLAKKGCAQFIEFLPELNAQSIQLPKNAFFIIANSLTEINKAATSDFNERVVECRIACCILAKKSNIENWQDFKKLAVLQKALEFDLKTFETLIKKQLTKDVYTKADIMEILDVNEEDLNGFLTVNTLKMETFKLRQRALHVIQESLRVEDFRRLCSRGDAKIEDLSYLMSESHSSLKHLYECSHNNLDRLVELSKANNVGARLTGAGWGGCIVALCNSAEASNNFMNELKNQYYQSLPQVNDIDMENVVFMTCPQSGAEIFAT